MSEHKPESRPQPLKSDSGTPFKQMTTNKKVMFIAKLVICIISFGMIFPNVMGD